MNEFKAKTELYKVYHIRQIGNSNTAEGYIGITQRSLPYRLGQHFNSTRPIGKLLRSNPRENIEIIQLAILSKQDALTMEFSLRPQLNIGWNCRAGGNRSTVKCPKCGVYLPKRQTGAYCERCNNTKFTKGHTPLNYGKGERYLLIDPQGNQYKPEAFTVFCKDFGLTPQNLRKVAKGVRKHHKGWVAVKI